MEIRELNESKLKQMNKRKIPIFRVSMTPEVDYSQISKMPKVEESVIKELVIAIKDGIKKRKKVIPLFDISYTQYSIQLGRDQWATSLTKAINYFESKEEYEKCHECKCLIEQLN